LWGPIGPPSRAVDRADNMSSSTAGAPPYTYGIPGGSNNFAVLGTLVDVADNDHWDRVKLE
jgi:hypothetical protein